MTCRAEVNVRCCALLLCLTAASLGCSGRGRGAPLLRLAPPSTVSNSSADRGPTGAPSQQPHRPADQPRSTAEGTASSSVAVGTAGSGMGRPVGNGYSVVITNKPTEDSAVANNRTEQSPMPTAATRSERKRWPWSVIWSAAAIIAAIVLSAWAGIRASRSRTLDA